MDPTHQANVTSERKTYLTPFITFRASCNIHLSPWICRRAIPSVGATYRLRVALICQSYSTKCKWKLILEGVTTIFSSKIIWAKKNKNEMQYKERSAENKHRNSPRLQQHSLNHRRRSLLLLEGLRKSPWGSSGHFSPWVYHHLNILTMYNVCAFPLQYQHFHQYAYQTAGQSCTWEFNVSKTIEFQASI